MAMCRHRGLSRSRCSMWGCCRHWFWQRICSHLSFVHSRPVVCPLWVGTCRRGIVPRRRCTRFLSCILLSTTVVDGRVFCVFLFRKTTFSEPNTGSLGLIVRCLG